MSYLAAKFLFLDMFFMKLSLAYYITSEPTITNYRICPAYYITYESTTFTTKTAPLPSNDNPSPTRYC
jgi:hypothetical protein